MQKMKIALCGDFVNGQFPTFVVDRTVENKSKESVALFNRNLCIFFFIFSVLKNITMLIIFLWLKCLLVSSRKCFVGQTLTVVAYWTDMNDNFLMCSSPLSQRPSML